MRGAIRSTPPICLHGTALSTWPTLPFICKIICSLNTILSHNLQETEARETHTNEQTPGIH